MLDSVLRALKDAGEWEVYFEEDWTSPVRFTQWTLQDLAQKHERGVGIRVLVDKRLGFSAGSDLTRPELLVRGAVEASRVGDLVGFSFPEPREVKAMEWEEPEWPVEERVKLGKEVMAKLREPAKGFMLDISLDRGVKAARLINHRGVDVSFRVPWYQFVVAVYGMDESGYLTVYDWDFGIGKLPDPWPKVERTAELLQRAKKVVPAPQGEIPVILAPRIAALLIHSLSQGLNGKRIYQGASPLVGKLGERILPESISILEDPARPDMAGSRPVDGEGVPTKRRYVVERGALRTYFLDLWSAWKLGTEPTGSAQRDDYASLPRPGYTNLVLEPGQRGVDEMISGIREGLLVYDTLGAGQSNLLAGDFSFSVSLGFAIKDGELIGRVKDTMVAGNFYKLDYEPSREFRVIGDLSVPHLLIQGARVASK